MTTNTCFLQMKRQQRKLNFLITQTELYAHFMARKMTGATDADRERILDRLSEDNSGSRKQREVKGGVLLDEAGDDYGECRTREAVDLSAALPGSLVCIKFFSLLSFAAVFSER